MKNINEQTEIERSIRMYSELEKLYDRLKVMNPNNDYLLKMRIGDLNNRLSKLQYSYHYKNHRNGIITNTDYILIYESYKSKY